MKGLFIFANENYLYSYSFIIYLVKIVELNT